MKFESSLYCKKLSYYKLELPFGDFFLCEKFIISELHAGIHFDWPKIKIVAKEVLNFYSENSKLGYISNRVNSYSVDPQVWTKVERFNRNSFVIGGAIVYYNDRMYLNATLEKRFSKVKIVPFLSLDSAIEWIVNLVDSK
ncbi:hypothetical protein [Flavivirga eckloniae]|uniref:STAS/SEC14 domain-containing protein n=1 Tax=Flavivirga eckloniae TaxID=1803846 RepID=A0A2K9PKA5_9FLAO|nr:hypothetical protein [Flavivirga eckloniae]AUP77472.1 hypothetical protein C1H87_01540 [Flavivirga eckloniae]